jgi:hypothetical protein
MIVTIVIGALVGGAVAWIWGAISWAVLPWHHATFLRFSAEEEFASAIAAHCPRSGVYGLPAPPRREPGMSEQMRNAADRAAAARMQAGPIVTAIVQRDGFGSVPAAMVRAFVIDAAVAAVITWMLLRIDHRSYADTTLFATAVGGAAALICRVTDWNWHGYSTAYTMVCAADHVVGGFLVGLALAAIV